jgi:hypothetical protein
MEGTAGRRVRVVCSLLMGTGLVVLRRFLVVSRSMLQMFSRLPMMFSPCFDIASAG